MPFAFAQKKPIKKPFWSVEAGLMSTSFLGDLGGRDQDGVNDFRDLDLNQTRMCLALGLNYSLGRNLSFGWCNNIGRLSANDMETKSSRTSRMLHVRTDFLESSLRLTYTIPKHIKNYKGLYFNTGIGMILYKPMAKRDNTWHDLRSLGTEGQLADPLLSPYSTAALVIPFGIGKKIYFPNRSILSIEFSFRKSFTDYLDDVSTTYYSKSLINRKSGELGEYFSDPSKEQFGAGKEGATRGNPKNNDNYFLIGVKLEIPIFSSDPRFKKRNTMRNGWIRTDGSVPTFRKNGKTR